MRRMFMGTIKAEHVGKPFWRVFKYGKFLTWGFGRISLCDVGKRVYVHDNIPMIEGSEQRDKRLMAEGY